MRSRKLIASLIGVIALFTLPMLVSAQSTFQTLFDFDLWDGKLPRTSILDKAGNLYGITQGGGTSSDGVIFKLAPNADGNWTRTILHNFSGLDGATPFTSLTIDQAGNLYGTTPFGGASGGYGVVFQLVPNSNGTWTENVLHSFNGTDGYLPAGGVIFDQAGNLYGTTGYGTAEGGGAPSLTGVVFELTPSADHTAWTETVLHSFCAHGGACADGAYPAAGLIMDREIGRAHV